MLTYSLNDTGGLSLYEYIYTRIKEDIITGKLAPHEKLPSKRSFAKNHDISIVTVENAYGQLIAEGFIYSLPKRGFFVSELELDSVINRRSSLNNTADNRIISRHNSASYVMPDNTCYDSNQNNSSPSTSKQKPIDFISGRTAPGNFPFATWSRIMRQTLSQQEELLLSKPSAEGVWELRAAIAKHLLDFRGISVSPEQIIIGAGTEYLYGLIVQLLGRDKIYGLENPCSNKIRHIYQSLDVTTVSLHIDEEGIIPPQLNSVQEEVEFTQGSTEPDIIQISPSHHFPTGVVTSIGRRYSLLSWANSREDRYIIEDDYDSEFRLQGKPIPSLFSIDASEKVIYFNTFSKTLASTFRISYMVLPKHLLERFKHTLGFYSCTVSNFEQYALATFIKEGYLERHINRMRIHFREMRDELISRIKSRPDAHRFSIFNENAGLHFLLVIDSDLPDSMLKQLALESNVALTFLSDYYDTDLNDTRMPYLSDKHVAIINYSGLEKL